MLNNFTLQKKLEEGTVSFTDTPVDDVISHFIFYVLLFRQIFKLRSMFKNQTGIC